MAEVALEGVSRIHDDGTRAVSGLSVVVGDGELLVLLGPSGCGKTTTLRLVAGLEPVSEGLISIAGRVVNDLPPGERDVALLAQEHLLYPHLSAADNLGFGLRCHGVGRAEAERQVQAHARALGIVRLLRRRPPSLSEGERQAVAFGRATTRRPLVYLLDEPLSGLDSAQRGRVRAEFARVRSLQRVTTLYVTADPLEAMAIADRLAVLRDGVLLQVGPPQELYERPASLFLAGFLGTPGISALLGTLEVGARSAYLALGRQRVRFTAAPQSMLRAADGRVVVVGIRPEHVHLAGDRPDSADRRLTAAVERVEHLGASTLVHTRVDAPPAPRAALGAGTRPEPGVGAGPGSRLAARLGPGFSARPGEVVELGIDTDRTLLFDPASGAAVWHGRRAGWA